MPHCRIQYVVAWNLVLVSAWSVGCQREPRANVDAAVQKVTPQESFDEITRLVAKALDTRADGVPSGFVESSDGGRSQFTVNNLVTSQLEPPSKPGDPYRGTITITTRSFYSYLRAPDSSKSDGESKATANRDDAALLDDSDSSEVGFGETNDGLFSPAPSGKIDDAASESGGSVIRRPDEAIRTFDLVYESDRWVLKTEPDPETDLSVKRAFEYALAQQR